MSILPPEPDFLKMRLSFAVAIRPFTDIWRLQAKNLL